MSCLALGRVPRNVISSLPLGAFKLTGWTREKFLQGGG